MSLPPWPVVEEGEVLDALLCEDAHIDLETQQGKDGQGKHCQDDHVSQVFHWLYHCSNYRFETWKGRVRHDKGNNDGDSGKLNVILIII